VNNYEESLISRRIDEAGRISIPREMQIKNGWGIGDIVTLHNSDYNKVVIRRTERRSEPLCIICGKFKNCIVVNSSDICEECAALIAGKYTEYFST